jgi:hypothetical protein
VRRGLLLGTLTALLACAVTTPAPAAAPQIDSTTSVAPGPSGWFTGPVTVNWTITGTITAMDCHNPETVSADTPSTVLTCRASNGSETTTGTREIRLDQTPPTRVVATPARPPDAAGWYTAPVGLTWSGSDATSGIASCTTTTYGGPDAMSAVPAGTCVDRAGNVSAPVPFSMAFDVTPPALWDVTATVGADRRATVRFTPGADALQVTVVRAPGDHGAPSQTVADGAASLREASDGPLAPATTYNWTVTARDAAGNATTATAVAAVPATSVRGAGTKRAARGRPVVRWRASRRASYYNVQVFRSGRKVLTSWPTVPRLTLPRTWRFGGRAQRLVRGVYAWYVWPGYGPRAQHRYGPLLAKGTVTVR